MGVGAMFTAVYAKYDLLIQWLPSNSSAQRLTNALASGVPVIAQRSPAFEDAYGGNPDVLLARGLAELRTQSYSLEHSEAFRKRVSDAGVAAASRFAPDLIIAQYEKAMAAASAARDEQSAAIRRHAQGKEQACI